MRESRFEKKLREYKAYRAREKVREEKALQKAAEEARLEKLANEWLEKLNGLVTVTLALECPVCGANIYAGQRHCCKDEEGNGAVIFVVTADITMQRKKVFEEKK